MSVTLVCGPPGSGKSTYVADHSKPGDLVWDHDLVLAAVTLGPLHARPPAVTSVVLAMRAAFSAAAAGWPGDVWFILSAPTAAERAEWQMAGARTVVLLTSPDLCSRSFRDRPAGVDWDALVARWYERWTPGSADELVARPDWWGG